MSYSMTQCKFVQSDGEKLHVYTAWIPTKHARIGSFVEIKSMKGTWRITEIYGKSNSDEIITNSRDHLRHRKATDI